MRSQTFRSIYPTDAPEKIRLKSQGLVHPAESLLQDLAKRKTPLEDLISGLREIGNKEAISIIEHREKWLEGKLFSSVVIASAWVETYLWKCFVFGF